MQTKLLINGALVAGEGESHAVYNPSQGNVLVRITEASGAQVHAAVQSADAAFDAWSQTPPKDRAALLLKLAERIDAQAHVFARLEADNCGKPFNAVLLDELVAAPLEQLHLPRPSDARLVKLADAILADPADAATLPQWAARIGMSERNMSRLFRQQTGMSVGRWRHQWHVIAGLQRLTSGLSVQAVAYELGYDSASAFVTMFKKAVGKPPGRFLAERTGPA